MVRNPRPQLPAQAACRSTLPWRPAGMGRKAVQVGEVGVIAPGLPDVRSGGRNGHPVAARDRRDPACRLGAPARWEAFEHREDPQVPKRREPGATNQQRAGEGQAARGEPYSRKRGYLETRTNDRVGGMWTAREAGCVDEPESERADQITDGGDGVLEWLHGLTTMDACVHRASSCEARETQGAGRAGLVRDTWTQPHSGPVITGRVEPVMADLTAQPTEPSKYAGNGSRCFPGPRYRRRSPTSTWTAESHEPQVKTWVWPGRALRHTAFRPGSRSMQDWRTAALNKTCDRCWRASREAT